MTDQELVHQVLNGDKQAFGKIVKNSEGLVTQIIFKMISDRHDRKDLAQEVYLKAYVGLGEFRFQSKLSTWIAGITYRTCISFLEKRRYVMGEPDEETEVLEEGVVTERMSSKELSGILQQAIAQLSPIYRTLVTLYHQEGLSMEEIVRITALPEGTVKNYLYRARKELQKKLLGRYRKEDLR